MLETSSSESLYGGQFTLLTQLIKPNYLVIPPPTQLHSFSRNFHPWLVFSSVVCGSFLFFLSYFTFCSKSLVKNIYMLLFAFYSFISQMTTVCFLSIISSFFFTSCVQFSGFWTKSIPPEVKSGVASLIVVLPSASFPLLSSQRADFKKQARYQWVRTTNHFVVVQSWTFISPVVMVTKLVTLQSSRSLYLSSSYHRMFLLIMKMPIASQKVLFAPSLV